MKMAVSKISGRPEEYFLERGNRVFLASEIFFIIFLEIMWANLITFSCSLGEEVLKLIFSEVWCELINYAKNRKPCKFLKKGDFRRAIWQGSAAFTPKFRLDLTEKHLMIHKYESDVWHIKQVNFELFCYLSWKAIFDLIRIKISLRMWPKTKGRFYTKTCKAMGFWARNTIITKTFENQDLLKS